MLVVVAMVACGGGNERERERGREEDTNRQKCDKCTLMGSNSTYFIH